jgi:hypothetical protein
VPNLEFQCQVRLSTGSDPKVFGAGRHLAIKITEEVFGYSGQKCHFNEAENPEAPEFLVVVGRITRSSPNCEPKLFFQELSIMSIHYIRS